MKISRNWWLAVLIVTFIAACSKDNSTEGNGNPNSGAFYIRCKIDGAAKTFNIAPNASKQDLGSGTVSYSVFGKAVQDANNFESFGFTIQIGGDLTAGTYKENDSTATYYLAGVYNPNTTDPAMIYASALDSITPFEITISDISDSLMAGTFKGKMYLNNSDANPPGVSVTEGEFKVRVQ